MRPSAAGLLASAAGALALTRSGSEQPWTQALESEQLLRAETPPRPTPARPLMARQNLGTMKTDTCGSVVRDQGYITCNGDPCIVSGDYIGCCNACEVVQSACVDFTGGTCNPGAKRETLCCDRQLPFCGTFTTAGTPALTNVACGSSSGDGGPFSVNPILLVSRSFSPGTPSSNSASKTPTAGTPTPTNPGSGAGQTNVGAIVGGVIGGIAALGLIAVAAVLLLRHRRHRASGPSPTPVVHSQPPGPNAYAPLPQSYDARASLLGQQPSSGQSNDDGGQYFAKPPGQNPSTTPEISPQATPPPRSHNQYHMSELAAVARGS